MVTPKASSLRHVTFRPPHFRWPLASLSVLWTQHACLLAFKKLVHGAMYHNFGFAYMPSQEVKNSSSQVNNMKPKELTLNKTRQNTQHTTLTVIGSPMVLGV